MAKSTGFLRHVSPDEEALLTALVTFANLRVIRSTRKVEALFMAVPLTARLFKVLPARDVAAYREDQATVRMWLDHLATDGAAARPLIGPSVDQRLRRTVTVQVTYDAKEQTVKVTGFLDGVEACFGYAVALLLDHRRGLTGRIGRCRWSRCRRFHVHRGEAGRPRTFCDTAHRRKAEAEQRKEQRRVAREARERQRQEEQAD